MEVIQFEKICVLIPFYNDSESLKWLIPKIQECVGKENFECMHFLLVNDGSTEAVDAAAFRAYPNVSFLSLICNLGHQRAIVVGLTHVAREKEFDRVVVMDADGEDRPEDLMTLIHESYGNPRSVIFAERLKRKEGPLFRFFYRIYKLGFRLLTGRSISFGNFCIIPRDILQKIIYRSEIWSHFAGGVVRSRLPYQAIPLERGLRKYGRTQMNFIALILHGFSAIAVHIDTVAVRVMMTTLILMALSTGGIIYVAAIKLFTPLAIPGWASTVIIGLFMILIQSFLISLFLIFIILSYRTQRSIIPAIHYRDYILSPDGFLQG